MYGLPAPQAHHKMTSTDKLVRLLKIAAQSGFYSGLIETAGAAAYMERCKGWHRPTGTGLIFTRDIGYHTSGWWKNPDYERCYHLSISFRDPETGELAPFDYQRGERWARKFFGHDIRWLWVEPPYSPEGKACGTHHYRLFCDAGWHPIKPRREVYSTEFTEIGWKSFSDIHGHRAKDYRPPMDQVP